MQISIADGYFYIPISCSFSIEVIMSHRGNILGPFCLLKVFHITGGLVRQCVVWEGEGGDQGSRQVLSGEGWEGGGQAKEV